MTEPLTNDEGFTEDQLWQQLEGRIGTERASTLIDLGFFAFQRSDHEQSLALADAAVEAAQDSDNDQVVAQAYRARGISLTGLGRHEEAAAAHKDAVAILERFDSVRELADAYLHVSWNLESAEIFDQALTYAENAQRAATEADAFDILARSHWQLADLLPRLDRDDEVFEHLSLCRQAWRQAENPLGVLEVDDRVSDRFLDEGDYKAAISLLRDCLDVASSLKDFPDKAPYFAFALGRALRMDGQTAEARKVLQQPLQYNLELGRMQQLGATYRELASCAADLDEMDEAFALIGKARAHFDVVGADGPVLDCDIARSIWLYGEGRFHEAAELNRSIELRTDAPRRYWARSRRADNLRVAGEFDEALALIEQDDNASAAEVASAAWFWRQAILVRVLDGVGRSDDAQVVATNALEWGTANANAATKAVLHEFRGNARADEDEDAARADWAHAVALYLAADMHGDATRLSTTFLGATTSGHGYLGQTWD